MTFEEWDKATTGDKWFSQGYLKGIFDLARKGMIPEDEAVRIPPVEEWGQAKGIVVIFSHLNDHTNWNSKNRTEVIKYIPRPVPAWTPKVGEAVFAVIDEHRECRFSIARYEGDNRVTWPNGRLSAVGEVDKIKPFSPEKIGLKWEEI